MHLHELVRYLEENSIGVQARDGRLNVTGDENLLSDELLDAIKLHRHQLASYYQSIAQDPAEAGDERDLPLSFAQQRLYFLYQLDPSATHFILPIELELRGALNASALCRALAWVVDGHKIYKTIYRLESGTVRQRYQPEQVLQVRRLDLQPLSAQQQNATLDEVREQIARQPFDLENELPLRVALLQRRDELHTLLLSFHHIATDEWSARQFVMEVAAAYRAFCQEELPHTGVRPLAYCDYAVWQRRQFEGGRYAVAGSYWRQLLQDPPEPLNLPLDRPRPISPTYASGQVECVISSDWEDRAKIFIEQEGISNFSFYLGLFYLLLHHLSGEHDLVAGTDVFGREHPALKNVAGFFVNQLALRSRVQNQLQARAYLQQVHAEMQSALDYQEMPFDRLVDELGLERDASRPPLFQVKFLYERASVELGNFEGLSVHDCQSFKPLAQYDLTLKIAKNRVMAFYNSDIFSKHTIRYWQDLYLVLLREVLGDPGRRIDELLQQHLHASLQPLIHGNTRELVSPSVFDCIDQQVLRQPQAVAQRWKGGEQSYAELAGQVGRIAVRLQRLGLRKGDKVAVFLDRSPQLVAAVVAIMRVGAVLVPLDTSYPAEHIAYTLADSGAAVVVTCASLRDNLPEYVGFSLDIDDIEADPLPPALDTLSPEADDAAYLLYTSGSTGRPKGVLISHASFTNLCDWYIRFAELGDDCRALLMIPIGFDASLKNIFAPLMVGGCVVLAPTEAFDPNALLFQISQEEVTLINCVPSAAYALLKEDAGGDYASLQSVRLLALGGEPLDVAQLAPWLESDHCQADVANIYGPTECTDISVAIRADRHVWLERSHVSIGRPIQNTRAYIVNDSLHLCPRGTVGELVVAGRGVGMGYHMQAELSADRFVFLDGLCERVYRTGDFCKYDGDGEIIYVGRRDGQLKIRGKRVEPGEIVHRIGELLPSRRVIAQRYVDGDTEMLVAFVDGGEPSMTMAQLKAALHRVLPTHMVPTRFVFVEAMPLTPNGKVDGAELLEIFKQRTEAAESASLPFNATEQLIAEAWEKVLRTPVARKDDDFFALGGDSIFSIQAVAELKQRGLDISVADMFQHSSLERLAEHAMTRSPPQDQAREPLHAFALVPEVDRTGLPWEELQDAYPATTLQQGMLFHSLMDRAGASYHDVFSFELLFEYDEALFSEAIHHVISLHPPLRTAFHLTGHSVPMQYVYAHVPVRIEVQDISDGNADAQSAWIEAYIERIKRTPFDLRRPGLIGFALLRRGENHLQCIVDAHHAILDGWSMAIVQRQVMEYYGSRKYGSALSEVFDSQSLRFADYVRELLAEEDAPAAVAFWNERCLAIPSCHAMPAFLSGPPTFRRRTRPLDKRLLEELDVLATREKIPLKLLLLMAHGYMLQALTQQAWVLSGMTDHGRPEADGAQHLVGLFLNVLPVLIDLRAPSWRGLASSLQHDEAEAKPFRRHPFASMVQRHPRLRVEANFTFTNFRISSPLTKYSWLTAVHGEQFEEENFALSVHANGNARDGLIIHFNTHLALSDAVTDALLERYIEALQLMARDLDAAIPAPPCHRAKILDLPVDRARTLPRNPDLRCVDLRVPDQSAAALRHWSSRHGVSLHTAITSAWAVLLARLSGQAEVVIGCLEEAQLPVTRVANISLHDELDGRRLLAHVQTAKDASPDVLAEMWLAAPIPGHHPYFQTVVALNVAGDVSITSNGSSPTDLSLYVQDRGGQLTGSIVYAADLFDDTTIGRWTGHLLRLMDALSADDETPIARLPLLSAAEHKYLLQDCNATDASFYGPTSIHGWVELQAERTPDAPAIHHAGRELSYAELNTCAHRFAMRLHALGIGPDDRVAICVERGVEMVVGLLGILKCGAAYVPLDPTHPRDRLRYVLADSSPGAIVTQSSTRAIVSGLDVPLIALDDVATFTDAKLEQAGAELPNTTPGSRPAYVLYTSGSTGQPKGVLIEHRSVVNLLCAMQQMTGITAEDRILAIATVTFDIAGLELFLPLISGACIVMLGHEDARDARALMSQLAGATILQGTPATWHMLLEAGWNGQNNLQAICGGEAMSPELAKRLQPRVARLWNGYGPTETTIYSTVQRIEASVPPSIGRPIANTQCYILDRYGEPVPIGVRGEIHIGGAGLARGYLNRAELTAERFIPNPFHPGERIYKTGDLGRWLADGTIEFLGRSDHQIKLRGFRIELGEIESRLRQCPVVREVVVVAREERAAGKQLVAYVVPTDLTYATPGSPERPALVAKLHQMLQTSLPEYMLPVAYVVLSTLPKTSNGKLDLHALPAPDASVVARLDYHPPQGDAEEAVAALWRELLGVQQVGRHDDFFELGGHSLLLLRMVNRIKEELHADLPMQALFQNATLAAVAELISSSQTEVMCWDEAE